MASDALISALMKDVAEGLEVLRVRDGVELTDAQIGERCRNMVANLVGNYFIVPIDEESAADKRAREFMEHLRGDCEQSKCAVCVRSAGARSL